MIGDSEDINQHELDTLFNRPLNSQDFTISGVISNRFFRQKSQDFWQFGQLAISLASR